MNHQVEVFLQLYKGFPGFAALVVLASALFLFLPIGIRYAHARKRLGLSLGGFQMFAAQALRRAGWSLCLLLVVDAFLISNHALARGVAVGMWDCDSQFLPYQMLVADFARAGRLIHWDPWTNGGLPLAGDPQVGASSPFNVILGFVIGGSTRGFRLYWLLVWALGGVGMILLAKWIKAPPWGAGVVAIGFLFSGIYTGHAEHVSWLTSFSALPWIIWRADAALDSRALRPAFEAGAIWGLSALGGYPGQTMITGGFIALWTAGRWLFPESAGGPPGPDAPGKERPRPGPPPRPTLAKSLLTLAIFLVIGGLILAPTYVSFFYEGRGAHDRVGTLSREMAVLDGAFAPGALSTFASPYLPALKVAYLTAGDALWPGLDVSMCSIYAGALIPALALFALFARPRERWRWWLLVVALFNLACAVGEKLPLRGWLYDWFYPTRFFRHPSLFRAYFLMAMAALALHGTRDLAGLLAIREDQIRKRMAAAATLVAATALLTLLKFAHGLSSLPRVDIAGGWKLIATLHATTVWLGAAGISLLYWKFPAGFSPRRLPALFLALALCDAFVTGMISLNLIAYTGNVGRWRALDSRHSPSLDLSAHGLRRDDASSYTTPPAYLLNNDQLIDKIPVFAASVTTTNRFQQGIWEDPALKRMAVGSERVWFAREAAQFPPSEALFREIKNRADTFMGFPIVIHSPQQMLEQAPDGRRQAPSQDLIGQVANAPAAESVSVNLLKYDPDELSFTVSCPDQGWLLVTDRWARSWRAEVNGAAAPVYGGNLIFRAVRVSAGWNQIKFRYHPFGRPWLVLLSWGVLATIALTAVREKIRQT